MQLPSADAATATVGRVEPSRAPRPGRPRDRKVWWWVAGLAGLTLAFGTIIFALADGGDPREARRVARETPSPTPEARLTVEEAYLALVGTIDAAEVADQIEEGSADDLRQRADDMWEAYQAGDAEEVDKKLQEFSDKLGEAADKGEVTLAASGRIDDAFQDLVLAIERHPPVTVEKNSHEENGGAPGPPPWAGDGKGGGNAHGND